MDRALFCAIVILLLFGIVVFRQIFRAISVKTSLETPRFDVSVIIPYHKDRGYLSDAIQSYENQEFTGTSELILAYGPEKTLGENLNFGVKKSKGKDIKVLHEADTLTPTC